MGHVKVCRMCLVADVKMNFFDADFLDSLSLETCYELIVGNSSTTDLPKYACYECSHQLKKFYLLRKRCLRAQAVLNGLLNSCGKIHYEQVKQIDKKFFQLSSNLAFSKVICIDVASGNEDEIKQEPYEELNNDKGEFNDDDSIKNEEFDNLYFSHNDKILSSDDDEPLSVHKYKKHEGVRIAKICDANENQNTTDTDVKCDSETTDINIIAQDVEVIKIKRGRGRPKKILPRKKIKRKRQSRYADVTVGGLDEEDDVETYCTVIRLTEEEQLEEITKRQTSSNYLNAVYQCKLCYKGFINEKAWKHHSSKHDPSAGDIVCTICKFRYKTKRLLQKHIIIHKTNYACKSCTYVSKSITQAQQHQGWHKGKTYKCQYCDEISTKWTSYLSHVRIKHPSEFICDVCGYSFVSKLGLSMHRTMMHKSDLEKAKTEGVEEDAPYCSQCDVKFLSAEAYKRHMVTSVKHTKSTSFNNGCRACGERFGDAEALRLHHRRAHAEPRPARARPPARAWPAACRHCSEVIPNAREYWAHFRRMHPDEDYPTQKNYICDICGKGFRGNAFLVYHKRTHTNEKSYKCQQCPKAFFNRHNLQMHEKTHSEDRPYPCSMCSKAFKLKGALDRHFRCHTGVKPYACEVCGKAFAQSNSCKLHVRTVHLKQPSPYVSRARLERRKQLAHHFLY